MILRIGANRARLKFADVLNTVHHGGQVVVVEEAGRPRVAMIPMELYEQLMMGRDPQACIQDRQHSQLAALSQ
jgi:prevent-host-death family protein